MADFRSERMPSPDGRGVASSRWRRAWEAYRAVADPLVEPIARPIAREMTFDLVGFYFAWHMHGGFEGLQKSMGMSRSAMYRRVSLFRRVFGQHPDEYVMPGMGLDVAAYLAKRPYGQGPVAPDAVVEAGDVTASVGHRAP